MPYKPNDLVLIHFKRGAKLAQVITPAYRGGYIVKIWNATSQKWSGVRKRSADEIMGFADADHLRLWRFPSPAAS